MPELMKRTTIVVTAKDWRVVKMYAKANSMTMGQFFGEAAIHYIDNKLKDVETLDILEEDVVKMSRLLSKHRKLADEILQLAYKIEL